MEGRKRARKLSIRNRQLLIAVSESDLEESDRLLEEKADVNFKDRDGNTALHWAVEKGDLKVVKLLLNKGAIIRVKNNNGKTPIELAYLLNKQDIIKILETSLNSKLPKNQKLVDKQTECKASKISLEDQNIKQISTKSEEQDQLPSKDKPFDVDIQSKQEKRVNPIHGHIYQLKLLMLFLYRGVSHKYSFRLGTEIKEAKKFDDLVFEYFQGEKKYYRLLQAKHKKDGTKKITVNNLLSENDGDFSLTKYFLSYQNSKKEKLFKDGSVKDVTICTNINFDLEDLNRAKIRIKRISDMDDILNVKSCKRQAARYKFNDDITSLLKSKLQKYSLGRLARISEYSDNDIKDFLNHLVFAVNQPNEEELGSIVKEEIGKELDFITTENVYNKFFITMLNWLQGKERGTFLSYEEGKGFFEEVRRGIHIWFGVKDPVESFIGRTKQLDSLNSMLQNEEKTGSQIVCISGLGGVGKTELVRKYISEYSHKYDNKILWINAESYQTLADSFHRLACDKLRIGTKNANGEKKAVHSIVEDVYKFFSNGKSLFIFDNAEKYKSKDEFDYGIDTFLPALPSNYNRPHVLITSRNQKWPKIVNILQLDVFKEEEAIEFIEKSLNIINDSQKENIIDLIEKLQHFPLALQQATAYIRIQDEKLKNVGSEFKISDYLQRYRDKTKILLNFEFPVDSDNDYTKTVLLTWNVTLDAIRQKEKGENALEFLNISSYLASEDIPAKMILKNKRKLGDVIDLLKQYSMVKLENKILHLHRLVQQVIRIQLKEQNREIEILTKAAKLFTKTNVNSKNVDHAISVWNYLSKHIKLTEEFSHLSTYICCEFLNSARFEEAYSFGLKVSELLSTLSSDSVLVLIGFIATQSNIAIALLEQGKYDLALKIYEEILPIQQSIAGKNHPETLNMRSNIAQVLSKQGKYNEAFKLYEKILNIEEITEGNYTSPVKDVLLSVQHDMAVLLINQGRYDEALQILQKIYNIRKNNLGEDNAATLNVKSSIAGVLANQKKYDEALRMFQEVCNVEEATFTTDHPRILLTKNNIAGILLMQGKHNDALQIYEEVLQPEIDVFGENHPDVLCTSQQIAETLRHQGKYDKALEMYQKVLDKQKDILGSAHPDCLTTQYGIAQTLLNQNKNDDALPILLDVFNKRKDILGHNHPESLKVNYSIAQIFYKKGEYDRALQLYQELYIIQKSSFGNNYPDTLFSKNQIGLVFYSKGEYDQALGIFKEVFNKLYKLLPADPHTLNAKYNIALVLLSQQKYDESLRIFNEVLDSQIPTYGEDGYNTITTKTNIATIFIHQGKQNEALKILRQVFEGSKKILGPENPETLKISNIIVSLMSTNDILTAVKNNNTERIEYLIKNDVHVNTKDSDNRTPLHYAVNNGAVNIVNMLLKSGADTMQVTNKGNTPLHIASSKNYKNIVEVLLDHVSCDKLSQFINAKTTISGATSLHIAAKNGFLDVTKSLLKRGAIYNIKNNDSETPCNLSSSQDVKNILKVVDELFTDVKNGNVQAIDKLGAMKCDEFIVVTNARNNQGNTLLQVAVANKDKNIAHKLLEMLKQKTRS